MTYVAFLLVSLMALGQGTLSAAGPKQIELRWSELAPRIAGEEVALLLPNGVRIQGEVIAVRPDELAIQVKKTSNRQVYAKGQASIPRSSVSTVELKMLRRVRGRVIGSVVGVIAGLAAGVLLVSVKYGVESGEAGWVPFVTGAAAGTLGYYGGRALDRQSTLIKIVPEAP